MQEEVLHVDNLTLCAGDRRILEGVSFTLKRGECFALVGESGSGKSLTSLAMMRLLPAAVSVADGDVRLEGTSLFSLSEAQMCHIRGKRIAMIFQEPMLALNPVKKIGDQIYEALRVHLNTDKKHAHRRVAELLEEVGLHDADYVRRYPHQLSGGQKQRVMIAMALACNPDVLIADEPTTALDVTIQAQILDLLERLRKKYRPAMLFISHDLGVVARVADRIGVLKEGKLVETALKERFFASPQHPYSKTLLRQSLIQIDRTKHTTEDADVLLQIRRLRVRFVSSQGLFRSPRIVDALKGVSLSIKRGKTLALVGESGSGKSTLAKAIVSLIPVHSGEIVFDGTVINRLDGAALHPFTKRIQMIFQDPFSSLDPRMRIGDIIAEGLEATGMKVGDKQKYIRQLLADVGIDPESIHRYPHAFSGGQRQRIAVARALALDPELIICDEPTSALDVATRGALLRLLKRLQQQRGIAYLFITHDLSLVPAVADDIAVMRQGELVEYGSADEVMRSPSHPYTRQLLEAVPRLPDNDTKKQEET